MIGVTVPIEDGGADKLQLACGHLIDGAGVGQPGQQVKCRNTEFEIVLTGASAASICPVCRARDDLRLYRTQQRLINATHPVHAQLDPHALVCPCDHFRFRLYDDGNTVETRCAQCGLPEELGTARSLGV